MKIGRSVWRWSGLLVVLALTGCGPRVSGTYVDEEEGGQIGNVEFVLSSTAGGVGGTWQARSFRVRGIPVRSRLHGTVHGTVSVERRWYGAVQLSKLVLILEVADRDFAGCRVVADGPVTDQGVRIRLSYMAMTRQCPEGAGGSGHWNLVRQ